MILAEPVAATRPTEAEPITVLRDVMRREERFVKVHAAEALIELGQPSGVHDLFLAQEHEHRDVPMYRLGVWRVLARTTTVGTPEHDRWIGELRKAALDPAAPDRIGAIESLAKLKYALAADERPAVETLAASKDEGIALFSLWLLSQAPGCENPQDRVARYLDSQDPITRLRAIYILRFLPDLSTDNRAKLKAAARAEPKDTLTHAYATSSSFIVARTYGDDDEAQRTRKQLYRILETGEPAAKQEACRALGEQGSREDLDAIAPLLADPAPPARIGAAIATARIMRGEAARSMMQPPHRADAHSGRHRDARRQPCVS
jgi:HEAT repeat protein